MNEKKCVRIANVNIFFGICSFANSWLINAIVVFHLYGGSNDLWKFSKRMDRIVTIVYLHHTAEKRILEHRKLQHIAYDHDDPLHALKVLGLNLGKDVKSP